LLVGSPLIAKAAGAHGREFYMISVGFTIQGACITLLMLYVVLREHSFWGRMLNSKVLKYIGVRSYSLYLWQQLFIGSQHFGTGRLILGLGGAALAAEASYRFIELPMLRVRHSFKPAPAHIQHHEARLTET
jgi:peptidoglycan/LPS O-acetylase OafA/YrhL